MVVASRIFVAAEADVAAHTVDMPVDMQHTAVGAAAVESIVAAFGIPAAVGADVVGRRTGRRHSHRRAVA